MKNPNESVADMFRGQFLSEQQSCDLAELSIEEFDQLEDAMKSVGLLHCIGCDLWTDAPFFDADQLCEECVSENSHEE